MILLTFQKARGSMEKNKSNFVSLEECYSSLENMIMIDAFFYFNTEVGINIIHNKFSKVRNKGYRINYLYPLIFFFLIIYYKN